MNKPLSICCLLLACQFPMNVASGSDWPTFGHDNSRAGWTTDELKLPLTRQWTIEAPSAPRRAWAGAGGRSVEGRDLFDRVKFDDAIQVAVAGNRVYFGSSVDHQVHCRDSSSGKELWSFYTGGPIRLAPTINEGRVYFGSDDGYAYCLDAENGKLIWKFRLGPADEWIIGRGELISRWPVRTGLVVVEGVAYFGAGVFPHENVYLGAVDAISGKLLWRNDNISHGKAGRVDMSPQGYLIASKGNLWTPSGRTRPWMINPKTGLASVASASALKVSMGSVAGTGALAVDGRLHTYALGVQVAKSDEGLFVTTGEVLVRMNSKVYREANEKLGKAKTDLRNLYRESRGKGDSQEYDRQADELRLNVKNFSDVSVDWKVPCKGNSRVIVAGSLVFVGGEGDVTAYRASDGKQVWSNKVNGEARGLAVADGKLFVSTTTGDIYCFGNAAAKGDALIVKKKSPIKKTDPYPEDQWTIQYREAAEKILELSGVNRGFCLVVGSENGRLAYELAKISDLKIYGIEPDEKKVMNAQRQLTKAGLYGHRVTFHQGDLSSIPYSNYFANLIVSDTVIRNGALPVEASSFVRHLKPVGGVVCIISADTEGSDSKSIGQKLATWLEGAKLGKLGAIKTDGAWATLTRGKLPGAGSWSHQYGEPGNTAVGDDQLIKGGLGVLWYGDPGPGKIINRHDGAVGPISLNGRLFVQGVDSIMAYDAYNGLFLWERKNPKSLRTGVYQNRHPGNLVASDESLFFMQAEICYELGVASGKEKAAHQLPEDFSKKGRHQWGYVSYQDGILFGAASVRDDAKIRRRGSKSGEETDGIFAIDVATGKHLWAYRGSKTIEPQTIAVGDGKVFFIDSSITGDQRQAILLQDKTELKKLTGEQAKRAEERLKKADVRLAVAVDARTGEKLWAHPVDVTDCSNVSSGGGQLTLMYKDDTLLLCGANANGHYWKQFIEGDFERRRLVALSAKDGYKLWAKDANYRSRPIVVENRIIAEPWAYDLRTGEQKMRSNPVTGKETPWSFMRPGHHCGMSTATKDMLFFRSGFTGFYDLEADAGIRHFAGQRMGCWLNAIPANGLVMIPESSAGCTCMYSIASTIVMEPREPRRPWSIFSDVGSITPVRMLRLNLGAPGDRRDSSGNLWLSYPRPSDKPRNTLTDKTGLAMNIDLKPEFSKEGGFFSEDGDKEVGSDPETRWIYSSFARGLKRCSLRLLGEGDKPVGYAVRMHFAAARGDMKNQRVFDVKVQGKTVWENVDVAAENSKSTLSRQLDKVAVTQDLVIELVPKAGSGMPLLTAIEVIRSSDIASAVRARDNLVRSK